MTAANYPDPILGYLEEYEGGFVDHPSDPGGATNRGVTQAVYDSFRRSRGEHPLSVRLLRDEEHAAIYRERYWETVRGDDLPGGVDLAAFDAAVNSGPARAGRWLQKAAGVKPDGAVGPVTLAAVNAADPLVLIHDMLDRRLAFLKRLRTWSTFGRGWERRVVSVRERAVSLARREAAAPPSPPPTDPVAAIREMPLLDAPAALEALAEKLRRHLI